MADFLFHEVSEKEREEIAERGYERVIKEHTYEKRFLEIFNFAQGTGAKL